MTTLRIGLFDSGVGGLSVLRALHALMPHAALHYVADSAHAPYGERDDGFITQRSQRIAEHLHAAGCHALVVACNTATAVAVAALRERFGTTTPVIGVEPGLKPALTVTRNGRIGVMATAATLRSAKFRALLEHLAPGRSIHLQACDGLAAAIERGTLDTAEVCELVEHHCAPQRAFGIDTVVLGCTHYPFVRSRIETALPGVDVIDTSEAVARRIVDLCGPPRNPDAGLVRLQTTGDPSALAAFAKVWLPFATVVDAQRLDV